LYLRAAATAEKPQGWLIASGVYRASLSKDTASPRLLVEELSVDFDLHVFGRAARVRLPFHRDEAKLLPDKSLLDGRQIQPEWEADGSALIVDIAEPGQYRLELAMRPTARAGDAAGIDMAIPRLATSRLELTAPEGAPPLEVISAIGAVRREEQPARIVAELGPAERLTVRWQDAADATASAPAVDADELFWLKIQPGSVVVEAKLKLRVVSGQLRRLQLVADPCLQLLPLAGPDAPAVQIHTPVGQPQIIDLQWPRPIAESATIDARFLFTGTSSVGNLRLPQLDVLDVRPSKRWLAVSVDAALEHQEQMPGRLDAVAVPEFTAAWGAAEAAPLFACRLAAGPSQWSMATRPRHAETAVEQTLALSFDGIDAAVQLDAKLTTSSGYVFQHRVLAPPDLKIEGISVLAGGVQCAARWAQDRQGAITVFLTGPVSGSHELSLRGRLPAPLGKKMPLPLLQIDAGHAQSSEVQLFRHPAVLIQDDNLVGLTQVKETPSEPIPVELGRLACWLRADGGERPQAQLTILPNHPKVQAEQTIRLMHEGNAWKAVFDCRLHVAGGLLDQFSLDAPPPWSGPLVVRPSRLSESPGENRRLVLRPRAAITGDYQFSVAGPLAVAQGESVSVPQIALHQIEDGKRFVILPGQLDDAPIAWELQGLRVVNRPDLLAGQKATVYEVVGAPFRAALSSAATSGGGAKVRLADIRIAWKSDGDCRGVATFDVEPGKASQCPLWLPAGFRLIQTAVDGVPMPPTTVGPRESLLPLGADRKTQRVEVVFDGGSGGCPEEETAGEPHDAGPSGPGIESLGASLPLSATVRRRFRAPMLGDLPVRQTIWTIAGPASLGPGVVENPPVTDGKRLDERSLPSASAAAIWESSLDDPQRAVRAEFQDRADSLTIRYAPAAGSRIGGRIIGAVTWAVLALIAAILLYRGALQHCFARWPYLFGIALGLAWWLWLWPRAAGVVIVVAVVVLQLFAWTNVGRRAMRSRFADTSDPGI
jgi:hypothetical protein